MSFFVMDNLVRMQENCVKNGNLHKIDQNNCLPIFLQLAWHHLGLFSIEFKFGGN